MGHAVLIIDDSTTLRQQVLEFLKDAHLFDRVS